MKKKINSNIALINTVKVYIYTHIHICVHKACMRISACGEKRNNFKLQVRLHYEFNNIILNKNYMKREFIVTARQVSLLNFERLKKKSTIFNIFLNNVVLINKYI